MVNNSLTAALKFSTRQALLTFVTAALVQAKIGALDLCVTKCIGEKIYPTVEQCVSYCKGEVMTVSTQAVMENAFADIAAHIPTPPEIINKTMQVAILSNRTLDLTVCD